MNIQGLGALITGAGSGLGEATARMLAARGAKVAILDMNADKGEAVAKSIGGGAFFVKANVASEAEVVAAVDQVVAKFGGLHIAVNCAGVGSAGRTVNRDGSPFNLDAFGLTIQINLVGTFNVCRIAASRMVKNTPNADGERGVMVNTASVGAFDGQIGQVAYAASKGGVVSMTLPMARDLAVNGIRVCTIAPGLFGTPLMLLAPKEMQDKLISNIPFPNRFGKSEEFAALTCHIVENAMLNGETIRLDGALRMPPK